MRIVPGMAKAQTKRLDHGTSDLAEDEAVDEHTRKLGLQFDALRKKRGISQRRLALQASIDPSHMGLFLKGKKRLSSERLGLVAQLLDGVLAVNDLRDVGDVVGSIDRNGALIYQGVTVTFPALFEIPAGEGFGPLRSGDKVMIVPCDDFIVGKYLVIETNGVQRLCQAVERGGVRGLLSAGGDVIMFESDRHAIVGVASQRHPAPEQI